MNRQSPAQTPASPQPSGPASSDSPTSLINSVPIATHVVLDYVLAGVLIAAPFLFGFSDETTPTAFFLLLGVVHLLVTIGTRFKPAAETAAGEIDDAALVRDGQQGAADLEGLGGKRHRGGGGVLAAQEDAFHEAQREQGRDHLGHDRELRDVPRRDRGHHAADGLDDAEYASALSGSTVTIVESAWVDPEAGGRFRAREFLSGIGARES